ncbi:substrate-binding periplasmic protein [Vibrio sp. HN007]|uniref:substrate-binding periplasmic protein n=1 Tax=Vibrio iocasae TaxID=3098914 RepID=UPI0035D4A722
MNKLSILLTIIIFQLFPVKGSSTEALEFVRIEGLAEQIAGEAVINEVYQRLGYDVLITPMPGKRAFYESARGGRDGEMLRIWSYGKTNPSLIRIPIPVAYIETQAFARSDFSYIHKDRANYEYAIVRGVQHTLDATMTFDKVVEFTESSTMMSFVLLGRADIALSSNLDGRYQLKLLGIKDVVPVGKVWARHPLYHYVHERHQALIPDITKMIAEMESNGDLERLWHEALTNLLDPE